jgi:hypothetical protein
MQFLDITVCIVGQRWVRDKKDLKRVTTNLKRGEGWSIEDMIL